MSVLPTLLIGFACGAASLLHAQCAGIHVEEVDNGGSVPGRTYRVYVVVQHDSDQVHMVYGEAKHPLSIRSARPFYQSPDGGPFSLQINRKMAREDAAVRYDSWLTIGAEDNYDNGTTNFLLKTEAFESGGSIETSDGAWFCVPGKPQTVAGADRRVLIGQFTSEGAVTGTFSVMGRSAAGEVFHCHDLRLDTSVR